MNVEKITRTYWKYILQQLFMLFFFQNVDTYNKKHFQNVDRMIFFFIKMLMT